MGVPSSPYYIKGMKTKRTKKTEKYKLIVFFAMIIILPYLFLYIEIQKDIFNSLTIGIICCYTPTLGVSLWIYFFGKEKINKQNQLIIIGFIITLGIVLLTYFNILGKEAVKILFNIISLIIGLLLLIFSLFTSHSSNMCIYKNKNKCGLLVLPNFIVQSVATFIVSNFNILSLGKFLRGVIFLFIGTASLFGEEYG